MQRPPRLLLPTFITAFVLSGLAEDVYRTYTPRYLLAAAGYPLSWTDFVLPGLSTGKVLVAACLAMAVGGWGFFAGMGTPDALHGMN